MFLVWTFYTKSQIIDNAYQALVVYNRFSGYSETHIIDNCRLLIMSVTEHTHCSLPCQYYCQLPPPSSRCILRPLLRPFANKSGMLGIGAMGPADLEAQACVELGFSRVACDEEGDGKGGKSDGDVCNM